MAFRVPEARGEYDGDAVLGRRRSGAKPTIKDGDRQVACRHSCSHPTSKPSRSGGSIAAAGGMYRLRTHERASSRADQSARLFTRGTTIRIFTSGIIRRSSSRSLWAAATSRMSSSTSSRGPSPHVSRTPPRSIPRASRAGFPSKHTNNTPGTDSGQGTCIWRAHGVWEWDESKQVPVVLQYDYFEKDHVKAAKDSASNGIVTATRPSSNTSTSVLAGLTPRRCPSSNRYRTSSSPPGYPLA